MPPMPKTAGTRARRNKSATSATLVAPEPGDIDVPELPEIRDEEGLPDDYHPATLAWWADIWSSPMAPEYDESDAHGLFMLAVLVNDYWTSVSVKERLAAAAEIRLQSQRFGLSPIDRRRLQWEISRAEEATDKTTKRRRNIQQQDGAAQPAPAGDPRAVLRAVQ